MRNQEGWHTIGRKLIFLPPGSQISSPKAMELLMSKTIENCINKKKLARFKADKE